MHDDYDVNLAKKRLEAFENHFPEAEMHNHVMHKLWNRKWFGISFTLNSYRIRIAFIPQNKREKERGMNSMMPIRKDYLSKKWMSV